MNTKIVCASIAGLSVIVIPACVASNSEYEEVQAEIAAMSATQELSKSWTYTKETDAMRGVTTKVASVRAEGWLTMSPELLVFRDEAGQPIIAIRGSLDEAAAPMMHCEDGFLKIKFDKEPVENVGCIMGMAVGIDPKIFDRLRDSETMWVETWTSIGTMQYKFQTANLNI